jgi:hypothetical protein
MMHVLDNALTKSSLQRWFLGLRIGSPSGLNYNLDMMIKN